MYYIYNDKKQKNMHENYLVKFENENINKEFKTGQKIKNENP